MNYEELKNIVSGNNAVILGDNIENKYLTDGLGIKYGKAEALVFAENEEEVKKVIEYANKIGRAHV